MKIILHRNSRPASPGHLTRKQIHRFAMLDERIRACAISLADDLAEIKRDKLYLAKFPTWEAYCAEVRQIGGRHGNRLIDYVEVKTTLIEAGLEAPASERHSREVKGTKAQQVATWAEVKRRERNGAKITGDLVREINQEILHPPEAEAIARKSRITDAARATILKAQRERWARVKAQGDSPHGVPASAGRGQQAHEQGEPPEGGTPNPESDADWTTNENGIFTKPLVYDIPLPAKANAKAQIRLGYAKGQWWFGYDYGLNGADNDVFSQGCGAGCGEHREGYATKEMAVEAAWQQMLATFQSHRDKRTNSIKIGQRCTLASESLIDWRNRYPERFPQETPAAGPLSQEPPSISVGTLAPGVLPVRNPDPEPDPAQANNNTGDGRPWQFTKPLKSPAPVPEPAKDPLDPKTTGEEIVDLLVQLSWTTDSRHVHVSLNRMRQYLEERRQWRAQRDAENAPKKAA